MIAHFHATGRPRKRNSALLAAVAAAGLVAASLSALAAPAAASTAQPGRTGQATTQSRTS